MSEHKPTEQDLARDLLADLALSEDPELPRGPWQEGNRHGDLPIPYDAEGNRLFFLRGGLSEGGQDEDGAVCFAAHAEVSVRGQWATCEFIAAAREGWPAAIRIALAERERADLLEQCSGSLCEKCGWNGVRGDEACAFCQRDHLLVELTRTEAARLELARKVDAMSTLLRAIWEVNRRDGYVWLTDELEGALLKAIGEAQQ